MYVVSHLMTLTYMHMHSCMHDAKISTYVCVGSIYCNPTLDI